jgi:hypothetical protein
MHDMQADVALRRMAKALGDRGQHLEAERSIERDRQRVGLRNGVETLS